MLNQQVSETVPKEQQFPRYTNEEAFKYANSTLSSLLHNMEETNERKSLLCKFFNLCYARNMEMNNNIRNNNIHHNLKNYVTYSIDENVSGSFSSFESIPDEFKKHKMNYRWITRPYPNDEWQVRTFENKGKNLSQEEADTYVNKKVNGLDYYYYKNPTINWDAVEKDILSGSLNFYQEKTEEANKADEAEENNNYSNYYSQFNNGRFHPAPRVSDFLTKDRKTLLVEMCVEFGIDFPQCHDFSILDITQIVNELEKRLGLSGQSFVVDRHRKTKTSENDNRYRWCRSTPVKKDTFKCKYANTLLSDDESIQRNNLRKLPFPYRSVKGYTNAIKLLSILRGRLHNVFNPSMQATGLVMDKTGLSFFMEKPSDPVTSVFVRLIHASFSAQKLFTIESQMHGGLDGWLKAILDLLIEENNPSTEFEHIFMLVPSERTISVVDSRRLELIYAQCIDWLKQMSILFAEQWELGVKDCAQNMMMVPRSGTTTIHVNAWNGCAGAWGNLLRFVRIIGRKLNYAPLQLFKVLKLTAGDQMRWADHSGSGVDNDVKIFNDLTLKGVMPWSGFGTTDKTLSDFNTLVSESCVKFSVEPRKWLGGPVERSAETKADVLSVCGVVCSIDQQTAKDVGIFGANHYLAT